MQENERSVTKRIPYNLEAEKAVLGACLIDSLMAGSMQDDKIFMLHSTN